MNPSDPPSMNESEMSVSDAAAMFRRVVGKNDRPYVAANKQENNRMVDAWKKQLLGEVASNGKLQANAVLPMWNLFAGGFEVPSTIHLAEYAPSITDEQVKYWKEFFETADVPRLWKLGKPVVGLGWSVIMNRIRFLDAQQKFDAIYQGSDEPLDWYSRSLAKRDLFVQPELPFWNPKQLHEIYEMVTAFLGFQTGPQRL